MQSILARRSNLFALLLAGALFFSALGFFVASGIDRPSGSRAADLWVDGSGSDPELQGVPSFAPIAEKMRPTVVHIFVTGKPLNADIIIPGESDPTDPGGDNGLPDTHPDIPDDFKQSSEGSGVIISEDGYILTNRHVIEGAEKISVTFFDGETLEATVVGSDARDDLALIKVEPKGDLPVAPLGDSDAIRAGEWVMALGNPLGFEYSVTVGVVSGKGRELPSSNFGDFLQTDAAIYPGNSGGPLFDLSGEVVGINTAVIPDTNLGFAVPINTAKQILPQLLESGRVLRGYLGVTIQSVEFMATPPAGVDEGVYVVEVHEGAPAAEAGIVVGDVIVSFDGTAVATPRELTAVVTVTAPGARAPVEIVRGEERMVIEVVVGSLPSTLE